MRGEKGEAMITVMSVHWVCEIDNFTYLIGRDFESMEEVEKTIKEEAQNNPIYWDKDNKKKTDCVGVTIQFHGSYKEKEVWVQL